MVPILVLGLRTPELSRYKFLLLLPPLLLLALRVPAVPDVALKAVPVSLTLAPDVAANLHNCSPGHTRQPGHGRSAPAPNTPTQRGGSINPSQPTGTTGPRLLRGTSNNTNTTSQHLITRPWAPEKARERANIPPQFRDRGTSGTAGYPTRIQAWQHEPAVQGPYHGLASLPGGNARVGGDKGSKTGRSNQVERRKEEGRRQIV